MKENEQQQMRNIYKFVGRVATNRREREGEREREVTIGQRWYCKRERADGRAWENQIRKHKQNKSKGEKTKTTATSKQ